MVKAFGRNLKDAGSSPARHYFPCIRLLPRENNLFHENKAIRTFVHVCFHFNFS